MITFSQKKRFNILDAHSHYFILDLGVFDERVSIENSIVKCFKNTGQCVILSQNKEDNHLAYLCDLKKNIAAHNQCSKTSDMVQNSNFVYHYAPHL
jgi:hypothetical protein